MVSPVLSDSELDVIQKCIVSFINNTSFWLVIGPIPVRRIKINRHRDQNSQVEFLAESIIATALKRRAYIFGSSSFSHWNQNEFGQGIEWAWYSVFAGAPIESHEKAPRLKNA